MSFATISEFRKHAAQNSEHFTPTDPPVDKKKVNAQSYIYRGHQIVTFFDSDGVEALEAKIIAKDYPTSPKAGKIKFSPKLLAQMEQRHREISEDLAKASGSHMSDGILMKPLADGNVALFISKDVTPQVAESILAILRNEPIPTPVNS